MRNVLCEKDVRATLNRPEGELDHVVEALSGCLAAVPVNQHMMQKMVINQAIEAMGFHQIQQLAKLFDGFTRHSPEGVNYKNRFEKADCKKAVQKCDQGTFDRTANMLIMPQN
ncbi:MAG: hypothetical protein CMM69_03425 [Rhodospirillaceae bacterium]|nr:hypothetical protein [Rhodospirillaceae bacterium]OUX30111.1 MAG: hypothetical protein CBE16_03695 [Rhodospirillaceae bacterium TMED256]